MKALFTLCLIVAIFALANASDSQWVIPSDEIIFWDVVTQNPASGAYVKDEITFPPKGTPNYRTITAVYVYDKYGNGEGAMANIASGGPGFKYVTLNFLSRYARGIYSVVEIRAAKSFVNLGQEL